MKNNRDMLIGEIKKAMPCSCIPAYKDRGLSAPDCAFCNHADDIAELIIQDRARIVEPLVKLTNSMNTIKEIRDAVHETIKLAGMDKL